MGFALYGINAVCMAMLAVSADKWEGSPRAGEVDSAVVIMELIALSGECLVGQGHKFLRDCAVLLVLLQR